MNFHRFSVSLLLGVSVEARLMGYIGNASIQEAHTNPMRKSRNPLGATKIRALPLAVALVATTCVMPAFEARADGWEIITPPSYSGSTSAQEDAYVAQWSDYFSGQVTTLNSTAPGGYPNAPVSTPSTKKFAIAAQRQILRENANGTGGAAQINVNGKVRFKVRWQRNVLNGVPDVKDNPPKFIYLAMNAKLTAKSQDAGGITGMRDPSKESASASIVLEGPTQNLYPGYTSTVGQDIDSNTVSTAALTRVIKMDVAGRDEFWTPWIELKAYANLAGNRSHTTYPYGASYPEYTRTMWRDGLVSVYDNSDGRPTNSWSVSNLNLMLSPSPDQLALDDGSGRTDPLNQYLINEGIPTSITVTSSDTAFTENLRVNSWWTLAGTAPALRPRLANVKEEANGTAIIRPQHPSLATAPAPNPTPTPENGLKFNVQTSATPSTNSNQQWRVDNPTGDLIVPLLNQGWNFPASNGAFGVKTFTHHIRANTVTAPIALFYQAMGFQHPPGGPRGLGLRKFSVYTPDPAKTIETPNFIYYYDQVWKNPWNIPVYFFPSTSSRYESTVDTVVIGREVHGRSGFTYPDTNLFAIPPGGHDLRIVGYQRIAGLDLYARTVIHECVHKLLYDALHNPDPTKRPIDGERDEDGNIVGDGLPDSIERIVGLDPTVEDTIRFDGGDEEVFARMCERDFIVNSDQDWADDGFNAGRVTAPNALQRQKEVFWLDWNRNSFSWADARSLIPTPTPTPQ